MRAYAGIFIIISLLLVGTVGAVIPDTVTVIGDKSYLTANGVDQSIITVTVTNNSIGVQNAQVSFTVLNNDPILGTFNSAIIPTDSNGVAKGIFKVNTKSGFADIRVGVTYSDGLESYNYVKQFVQNIDHDKPNKVIFAPPYEGTAGTIVAFNASFTDQWGNPIDNQINSNQSHLVTLHVTGPSNDCNFVDLNNNILGPDLFDTPLDIDGNVPVRIKLTSVTGSNYVSMEAFDMMIPPKVIKAIPGRPFYITQSFDPNPPKLPSGASLKFVYTLYDKFMNPAGDQYVWVNMSSKQILATTQDNGQISGTYEEIITGSYTITATAVNNNSVTSSQAVEFYAAEATNHNVVANPKMMPSRDVKSDIYSTISAKVVDGGGNGVNGETVTFTISDISYSPIWVGNTSKPSFNSTGDQTTITAITGADGINGTALVKFYPGAFVKTGTNYSQTATGDARIVASWNGIPKTVDVSWKNYAFLSAILTLTPPQVKVGDTVDVNLKLNGDGFSMTTKPIDAMLIIDRSGSMLWNDGNTYNPSNPNPRRIDSAKDAAITFVESMRSGNNQVGLVSFASTTTTDRSLTDDFDLVESDISDLSATGATQMRRALYEAITDVETNGRSDGTVKAVILLTDGDWNYDQSILAEGRGFHDPKTEWSGNDVDFSMYQYYDELVGEGTLQSGHVDYPDVDWSGNQILVHPLNGVNVNYCDDGQFTNQNMSIYAQENGIRLYALSFVYEPVPKVKDALNILTTNTGGFYKHAATEAELNNLYTEIAGQLIEDAGVETTADMDFGHLIVDDTLIDTSTSGNAVFDYVGDPETPGINPGNSFTKAPGSTMVDKYNKTGSHIVPGPDFGTQIGPLIVNQTTDWNDNKALSFNIGLVKLGETWETNFRLKVLKEGTIMLFNPGSTINFKDYQGVESSLALNNLSYLTAVDQPEGLEIQTIDVYPICPPQSQSKDPLVPINWITTYNGTATTVYEEGRYMSESGAWVMFYSNSYAVGGDDIRNRSATFDLRRIPPGSYTLNIKAYTTGSKSTSSPTCGPYYYNTTGIEFIRLR
jgi:hypothetical protein